MTAPNGRALLPAPMADRARLEELAGLYGVQTSHWDALGNHHVASEDVLVPMLASLGAPLATADDVEGAIALAHRTRWARFLDPVAVVWDSEHPHFDLRVPEQSRAGPFRAEVTPEDGESFVVEGRLEELEIVDGTWVDGREHRMVRLWLPRSFPHGYHTLTLHRGSQTDGAMLIAAPRRAFAEEGRRDWGIFLPLYALRAGRSTGSDLTDLRALVDWSADLGASVVGTLPLLSAYLDDPFEPSPYAPVSRLFWNELFLAPEVLPEMAKSPQARARLASSEYQRQASELRGLPLIDYRRQMALRRGVLEDLARSYFERGDPAELARFLGERPQTTDYARFRATAEARRCDWTQWPERLAAGTLEEGDYEQAAFGYHLYVQWRMAEQLDSLCESARARQAGLYLDLPLGVHPGGYDAWRERECFVGGCSAGAPPDMLFTEGQNWGFAPLSPEGIRRQRYRYVLECLRHQMRCAKVLRIDHVMWLYRIYCVPAGVNARQGLYVRYRQEELLALVSLESHRQRTMIVGEDLGTVPDEVRAAMREHRLRRMYVMPFELAHHHERMIAPVQPNAVAAINTHDLPTFEGFWSARDIQVRVDLGLLDAERAEEERRVRTETCRVLAERLGCEHDPAQVLRAALAVLAAGPTPLLLVNLEDLWLEQEPQNVPGTGWERPNWRRRARLELADVRELPAALDVLGEVNRQRRGGAT